MPIDNTLLTMLICPSCSSTFTYLDKPQGLHCEQCNVIYPIRDGIPILITEEAIPKEHCPM